MKPRRDMALMAAMNTSVEYCGRAQHNNGPNAQREKSHNREVTAPAACCTRPASRLPAEVQKLQLIYCLVSGMQQHYKP